MPLETEIVLKTALSPASKVIGELASHRTAPVLFRVSRSQVAIELRSAWFGLPAPVATASAPAAAAHQSLGIGSAERGVIHIGVSIDATGEPNGIALNISPDCRLVIAEVVVLCSRLYVEVLARETQVDREPPPGRRGIGCDCESPPEMAAIRHVRSSPWQRTECSHPRLRAT